MKKNEFAGYSVGDNFQRRAIHTKPKKTVQPASFLPYQIIASLRILPIIVPPGQMYSKEEAGHLSSCLLRRFDVLGESILCIPSCNHLDVFSAQKRQTSGTAIYGENKWDSPQSRPMLWKAALYLLLSCQWMMLGSKEMECRWCCFEVREKWSLVVVTFLIIFGRRPFARSISSLNHRQALNCATVYRSICMLFASIHLHGIHGMHGLCIDEARRSRGGCIFEEMERVDMNGSAFRILESHSLAVTHFVSPRTPIY